VVTVYPLIRGLLYIALLLTVGVRVAGWVTAGVPRGNDEPWYPETALRLDRLRLHLGWILPLFLLLRGGCQVAAFAGSDIPISADVIRSALFQGGWGHAWSLQIAAAVVLGVAAWTWRARPGRWVQGLLLAAVIWGQTGTGHAAERIWPDDAGRLTDAIHLVGGGLWLGTLGALLIAVLPALQAHERMAALYGTIRRFSRCAQAGVALLIASGVIAAWRYAGSVSALVESTWGRLLMAKVLCLVGVLAMGWWNWRVVTPSLGQALAAAPARLRRSIRTELMLGLLLLAITALLVASPLPGHH
jgi:putative copper export protein